MSDVPTPDGLVFDADNHYYEALDAFTRHLDPQLGPRVRAVGEIDGRKYHVVGGKVSRAVVEPDVRPDRQGRRDARLLPRQPRRASSPLEFLARPRADPAPSTATATRASRRSTSRASTAIWLFPTLGVLYEELLRRRSRGASTLTFTAFNRWLDEDWGFAYQDRIFAAPYISLADVDWAVERARVGARPAARARS